MEGTLKTTAKFYRVNPKDICFIRYVFEAHDGLAVISTLSGKKDTIALRSAPGCEEDVLRIVSGLKQDLVMEEQILKMDVSQL